MTNALHKYRGLINMNLELNKIYNMDCLEGMKLIDDNSIDCVITDPPYGINADKNVGFDGCAKSRVYKDNWDFETPSKEVFVEILRVSKKVIIFGGNYFTDKLPQNNHWIVWDKQKENVNKNFSDCELIYTNIDKNIVTKYVCRQHGFINDSKEERVHPTQKPLLLIKEIIKNYTNKGDIILDPFMGSGTTAVACKELQRNFIGFEISKEYCDIANQRLEKWKGQERLF